jgi:hypothetical protein
LSSRWNVHIGREALGIAAGLEDRNRRVDMRQVRRGLRYAPLVVGNRLSISAQRRDGAYLGHAENLGLDGSEGLWRLRHDTGNNCAAARPERRRSQYAT